MTDAEIRRMAASYRAGANSYDIAADMGYSVPTVLKYLRRARVPVRTRGEGAMFRHKVDGWNEALDEVIRLHPEMAGELAELKR